MKYALIDEHRDSLSVTFCCQVLGVSRSGYYAWKTRPVSKRSLQRQQIVKAMELIHSDPYKNSYGSPRLHQELRARGYIVSLNTVARYMQAHHLRASSARKFRATTDSAHSHPVAENLLNQEFTQKQPDHVWVSDLTYVSTREGWLYLVCVLDLYSRRVVGFSMGPRMSSGLMKQALQMAIRARDPQPNLLHHSDRGSQYCSRSFQEVLTANKIRCSMSRKGNCYDNAVMESFFASLKKELVHRCDYATREEARLSLFEYIEVFYNRVRRHSALGYVSPVDFERQSAGKDFGTSPTKTPPVELFASPEPVLAHQSRASDRRPAPTKTPPGEKKPALSITEPD